MSGPPWTTCYRWQPPTSSPRCTTTFGPPSTKRSSCRNATSTPTTRIFSRIRSERTDLSGHSTSSSTTGDWNALSCSLAAPSARSPRSGPTQRCLSRRTTTSPKSLKFELSRSRNLAYRWQEQLQPGWWTGALAFEPLWCHFVSLNSSSVRVTIMYQKSIESWPV